MSSSYRETALASYRTYLSVPDSPEGRTALRVAQKYAQKAGLTLDELISSGSISTHEIEGLSAGSKMWELALLDLVFASRGIEVRSNIALFECDCSKPDFDAAMSEFVSLRRKTLSSSGSFARKCKMMVGVGSNDAIVDTYCCWFVFGIGEEMISSADPSVDMPRWDALVNASDDPVVEVPAPSGHRGQRYTNRKHTITINAGLEGMKASKGAL